MTGQVSGSYDDESLKETSGLKKASTVPIGRDDAASEAQHRTRGCL